MVRGSTATKHTKKFSDFDIEVWATKLKKPYYEIALIKEKRKRGCQLLVDFFFKYLRTKDKKYLQSVQKRI